MKVLVIPILMCSFSLWADTTYSPNDGQSPPGTFSSKMDGPQENSKTIIKSTTIQKEEVGPAPQHSPTGEGTGQGQGQGVQQDKPVLDGNPNDQTYRVGPLPDPEDTVPKDMKGAAEMEAQEENSLDYSTTPENAPVRPSEQVKQRRQ